MFVFSPSNMQSFRDCPRRFQGQSLTKEIPWKSSAEKSYGQLVHTLVEKALKYGMQAVTSWPDNPKTRSGPDAFYVTDMVNAVRQQVMAGAKLFIEQEMTIGKNFKPTPTGWWDESAFLRARADAIVVPVDNAPVEVIDIKTGKKWDEDDFQLRVNCLLAHLVYQRPVVKYAYWYVDTGETVDGIIDFANGLSPVQDVIETMKEMQDRIKDGYFPATKNKFCRWCSLHGTPACGEGI